MGEASKLGCGPFGRHLSAQHSALLMLPAHGKKEKTLLELTAFEEEEGGPAFYSVAPNS